MAEKLCQLKKKGGSSGTDEALLVEGRFFGRVGSNFITKDGTTGSITTPYAVNCYLNGKYSRITTTGYGTIVVWHKDGTYSYHPSISPGGSVALTSNDELLQVVAFSSGVISTYTLI